MNETKPWWQSQTIIASVVAMLGVALRLAGKELSSADQAAIVNAAGILMNVGGSLWAIYGRVIATTVISKPS